MFQVYPALKQNNARYMLEQTELRKADRTVGVNCYIFCNISSGTASADFMSACVTAALSETCVSDYKHPVVQKIRFFHLSFSFVPKERLLSRVRSP